MKPLKNLVQRDFTKLKTANLNNLKRLWAKETGFMPRNSQILLVYRQLLQAGKILPSRKLEKNLQIRKSRSLSGVTPLAVMTPPFVCPGACIYCPQEPGMPKSYLSDEPAAQRAKSLNFKPQSQVKSRLTQLTQTGHNTTKIEIIIIGGTFSVYPKKYRQQFVKEIFNALNNQKSNTLTQAQILNETAQRRVVGLSIETRPDQITPQEVKFLRFLGVTKIQLGVQAIDDKILQTIKRGHTVAAIAKATQVLRNAGFKICYHFMPNLPGSNPQKDLQMVKKMFQDPRFKPDYLKIYPTQVIPGTKLHLLFKAGKFKTYSNKVLKQLLKDIKLAAPPWVRIDRLVRDISKKWIAAGTIQTNLRQVIQQELQKENKSCLCIRCREVKSSSYRSRPKFKKISLETQGGQEYLLSFEDNGTLYSLLRLRLPGRNQKVLFKELKNAAIIRELHTFGPALALKERQIAKTQHRGLGKKLIQKAKQISKKSGFKKLAVIAAIGTKKYYQGLGFKKADLYMIKDI